MNDLDAARDAFERALATAAEARLAVWRLRALHELGTIDMFDHAGADRLSQARRIADELGAASTGAIIDLQLTAAAMFRFDLVQAERHARSALAISTRLGLAQPRAIVLLFLGEVYAMRRDPAEMDRFLALASAAAPGDPEIEGSALAGARDAGAARRRPRRRPRRPRPGRGHSRRAAAARTSVIPRHVAVAARRAR